MEQLKAMKEQLMSVVQTQMGQLDKVNTKELGEAIDMIKDLAMTMYYCSVAEAMEENKGKENMQTNSYYYTEKYLPYMEDSRMYEYYYPKQMYYSDSSSSSQTNGQMRDYREGRSGQYRKMYMESKHMNQDSTKKIQELENYMKELTTDITEMIQDASPEEKAVLQKKVNTLANKLQNV